MVAVRGMVQKATKRTHRAFNSFPALLFAPFPPLLPFPFAFPFPLDTPALISTLQRNCSALIALRMSPFDDCTMSSTASFGGRDEVSARSLARDFVRRVGAIGLKLRHNGERRKIH